MTALQEHLETIPGPPVFDVDQGHEHALGVATVAAGKAIGNLSAGLATTAEKHAFAKASAGYTGELQRTLESVVTALGAEGAADGEIKDAVVNTVVESFGSVVATAMGVRAEDSPLQSTEKTLGKGKLLWVAGKLALLAAGITLSVASANGIDVRSATQITEQTTSYLLSNKEAGGTAAVGVGIAATVVKKFVGGTIKRVKDGVADKIDEYSVVKDSNGEEKFKGVIERAETLEAELRTMLSEKYLGDGQSTDPAMLEDISVAVRMHLRGLCERKPVLKVRSNLLNSFKEKGVPMILKVFGVDDVFADALGDNIA